MQVSKHYQHPNLVFLSATFISKIWLYIVFIYHRAI